MKGAMSSGDDLKSSAQVWGGNSAPPEPEPEPIDDLPPAYTGAEPVTEQSPGLPVRPRRKPIPREPYNPVHAIAKWARIPWSRYVVPDAVVSADRTMITTTHPTYLSSQQALIQLLGEQADLPPIPTIRITGNHMEAVSRVQKTDFDIVINLGPLLDLSKRPHWRNKPAQAVPLPNASGRSRASNSVTGSNAVQLESLARQFLKDKSDRKSFVLSRTIENMPTDVIEGLVRNLVASLNYRGRVNVSFPVQSGQLIIQKKPGGTGAAVGGWFMNVLGLSPDVKYETLERVWEIGSSSAPGAEAGTSELDNDGDTSVLIKEWWNAWSPAIRDAVLLRKQGKVGIEDWMEAQMGWRPKAMTHDWGVDYV